MTDPWKSLDAAVPTPRPTAVVGATTVAIVMAPILLICAFLAWLIDGLGSAFSEGEPAPAPVLGSLTLYLLVALPLVVIFAMLVLDRNRRAMYVFVGLQGIQLAAGLVVMLTEPALGALVAGPAVAVLWCMFRPAARVWFATAPWK